jgi:hypothetical protein
MAAEWRELTDDAKAPFIAETEVHKKRYEGEKHRLTLMPKLQRRLR